MSEEQPKSNVVDLRYIFPDEWQSSAFANHFVVQQTTAGEYRLSFFEIREPAQMMGCIENRQQKLEELGYAEATCVATLVMTKQRVLQMLAALAENVTKSAASKDAPKTEGK